MLAALTDVTFRVVLDQDGAVQSVYDLPASSALSASTLHEQLEQHHAAQCRLAHQQQRAETFDIVCERPATCDTWSVTLVPAEARSDEAAALFGAAREVTASRQNRAALRETAAIQHHLVELLPDAIIITGADDRLLFVNSAAADLLGASREEEILGASIWQFVHPESRSHARERKRQLQQGEAFDFVEHKLVRLDGSVTSIETASVPIVYRGKRAALIAARDLSGRKSMAEALSRTLDLFDKAFHLGPAALVIARLSDGAILEVSDQMAELTGYRADELMGRDLRTLDLWVNRATRNRLAKHLADEGRVWEAEFQIRRKDGATRTVLGSAYRIEMRGNACLLASVIDITERRRAASAAEESRALLSKIFHASPTAIGIFCMDDHTFFDVNEA
ncbi:MAG: PAS domain S-box protein, partial [Bacteroidetes bacterium]|nr:PAS domain S-box protein [Bacteroidota bacterium]